MNKNIDEKEVDMNDAPYFPLYASDWLADENIKLMSMAGEGCYIHLLTVCWREGSIPADRKSIVILCKNFDGPGIDEALKCFVPFPKKDGRLYNKRLDEERKKMKKYRKLKKLAGLRGAKIKWQNHDLLMAKNSTPIATPLTAPDVLPMAKDSSSSSSSSSYKDYVEDMDKSKGQNEFDPLFEQFWDAYPKKTHKEASRSLFMGLCKKGYADDLSKGFNGYVDFLKHQRVHKNFKQEPSNPETFLRKDRWREYIGFVYKAPM